MINKATLTRIYLPKNARVLRNTNIDSREGGVLPNDAVSLYDAIKSYLIINPPSGGGGGATNLTLLNNTATTLDVNSSTGADVTLPAVTTTTAGLATVNLKLATDAIGIVPGQSDLDTFTGVTIPDNSTVKVALQALETALELVVSLPPVSDMYNSDALAGTGGVAINESYWAGASHNEGAVHGTLKLRLV